MNNRKYVTFLFWFGLFFIILTGGGLIAKYTNSFWIGGFSFFIVFVIVMWFSLRNFRISFAMVRNIQKNNFLEAIRIGEKALNRNNDVNIIKINLIAAYYKNREIDKACSYLKKIDSNKLSLSEEKILKTWKNLIEKDGDSKNNNKI